jgi:hypothetical protein
MRESMSLFRTIVQFADEIRPPQQPAAPPPPEPERDPEEDSPVRILDTGLGKVIINKSDGSGRLWETGAANLDRFLNFIGEQTDKIRKAQAERETRQAAAAQPRPQLPAGYIEVGADGRPLQQPPPGYVVGPPMAVAPAASQPPAAPAAPVQQALPEPPAQMPPPISEAAGEPKRRTWGMPPGMGG